MNLTDVLSPIAHGRRQSVFVRIGRQGSGHLSLGGDWMGSWVDGEGVTLARQGFDFFAQISPGTSRFYYVRAGLGFGIATTEDTHRPPPEAPREAPT